MDNKESGEVLGYDWLKVSIAVFTQRQKRVLRLTVFRRMT